MERLTSPSKKSKKKKRLRKGISKRGYASISRSSNFPSHVRPGTSTYDGDRPLGDSSPNRAPNQAFPHDDESKESHVSLGGDRLSQYGAMSDADDFDRTQQDMKMMLMEEIARPNGGKGARRRTILGRKRSQAKFDQYNPSGMGRSLKREAIERILHRYKATTKREGEFIRLCKDYVSSLNAVSSCGRRLTDWMRSQSMQCDDDQKEFMISIATNQMAMDQQMEDLSMVMRKEMLNPLSATLKDDISEIDRFEREYLLEANRLDAAISSIEHETRKGKRVNVQKLQDCMHQLKAGTMEYETFCSTKLRELSLMERKTHCDIASCWLAVMRWLRPQLDDRSKSISSVLSSCGEDAVRQSAERVPPNVQAIINHSIDHEGTEGRVLVAIAPPPKPSIADMELRSRDSLRMKPRPPSFYSSESEDAVANAITHHRGSPGPSAIKVSLGVDGGVWTKGPSLLPVGAPPRVPSGELSQETLPDGADPSAEHLRRRWEERTMVPPRRVEDVGDEVEESIEMVLAKSIDDAPSSNAPPSPSTHLEEEEVEDASSTRATTTRGERTRPAVPPRPKKKTFVESSSAPSSVVDTIELSSLAATLESLRVHHTHDDEDPDPQGEFIEEGDFTLLQRRSTAEDVLVDETGLPMYHVMVVYEWKSRAEDELSVLAGTKLRLISAANELWWLCRREDTHQQGLVPANYLALL